jgi:hypothetical protein
MADQNQIVLIGEGRLTVLENKGYNMHEMER